MLSPSTRKVVILSIAEKRRDMNERHLALAHNAAAIESDRAAIAQHKRDIAELTSDLERDDQARADAGDEVEHPETTVAEHERRRALAQADMRAQLTTAARPPVSLTGSHLTDTTAQEG